MTTDRLLDFVVAHWLQLQLGIFAAFALSAVRAAYDIHRRY